jgi:hypothetical protein
MKKLLLAGGPGWLRACGIFAVLGIAFILTPPSYAQKRTYTVEIVGLPQGSAPLSDYIGLDRKLKANVAGQTLQISVDPPLSTPLKVRLSIVVTAQSSIVKECNTTIATATTVPFDLSGGGRSLGASDFTGGGGIGIQTSTTNQSCIDALADKIQNGTANIPTGIYQISATLNDASTGALLGSGGGSSTIQTGSTAEATINLTSPGNGDQVPQSASIVFSFENSIPGRLLAFEHSSVTQSPQDAARDLNSTLKVFDVDVPHSGSNQVVATSPGVATRPWMAGKKYSWYFLGSYPGSSNTKASAIYSFTVVPSDPEYARLVAALSNAADPIGSTFSNLINSGYTLNTSTGRLTLQEGENGASQIIDATRFFSLLADLARRNVQLKVGVVTQ